MRKMISFFFCMVLLAAFASVCFAEENVLSVAALKGPTGLGLGKLISDSDPRFEIDLFEAPDVVTVKFINGEIDVAAVPVNLASVLYNKTGGDVSVLAVNTLGVLYILENGDAIHDLSDLEGKKLYATGEGSTPQFILEKLLNENGLNGKVDVEYVGEHAALAAMMASGQADLCMLPEPNVSSVLIKNPDVRIALDLNAAWNACAGTELVQGVYIARTSVLNEKRNAVEAFITAAGESATYMLTADDAPSIAAGSGIVGSEEIAEKAMHNCNMVCIVGERMRSLTENVLKVLFEAAPASVGGALPGDGFYAFIGENK